jgi:hypothetical protein
MPAIDFPPSPSVNNEYPFGGRIWIFNGTGWEIKSTVLGTASTKNITTSTADPSGGIDGDIWIKYTA